MNIEDFNRRFIARYLILSQGIRSNNSYPFLINFKCSPALLNVPIYFKQPQHWLSRHYGEKIPPEDLLNKLMLEYDTTLLSNSSFKPIQIFQEYKRCILRENTGINLIYNNVIKFSKISNPDTFDGDLTDQFNDLFEEEYQIIQPQRSVFCIGPNEDYTGLMSWKLLNDIEIKALHPEHPFYLYKDKFGNEVLHTYHPNYWFKINSDLQSIVYNFIIGAPI